MTVGERLDEIIARYGPDSEVGRGIVNSTPALTAAVDRVAER